MTTGYGAFALITASALAALLAIGDESGTRHGVLKGIASAGFVGSAIAVGALDSAYGIAILCGLVLSWLGDVLLVPAGDRWFIGGLASFLLAHVAYGVGFTGLGVAAGPAVAGAVLMVAVGWWVWRMIRSTVGSLKGPVLAYVGVIGVMVATAAGAAVETGVALIALGGLAFAASDIAVARRRFVSESPVHRMWGLPTYYAAQLMLALTVALV